MLLKGEIIALWKHFAKIWNNTKVLLKRWRTFVLICLRHSSKVLRGGFRKRLLPTTYFTWWRWWIKRWMRFEEENKSVMLCWETPGMFGLRTLRTWRKNNAMYLTPSRAWIWKRLVPTRYAWRFVNFGNNLQSLPNCFLRSGISGLLTLAWHW